MTNQSFPLARFKVLDLTRARAGPTCVRQLVDWGAQAIKIEMPGGRTGDGMGGNRHGFDFQKMVEAQSPARTRGAAGGYRAHGSLSGVVGLEVHDREDAGGVGGLEVTGVVAERVRNCALKTVRVSSTPSSTPDLRASFNCRSVELGLLAWSAVLLSWSSGRLSYLAHVAAPTRSRHLARGSSRGTPTRLLTSLLRHPRIPAQAGRKGEDGRRKRRLRFLRLTWLSGSSSSGTAQSTESTPHDYELWSHHHDVR